MPNKRNSRKKQQQQPNLHPPQHDANLTFSHAFRFSSTVGTIQTISVGDLIGVGGVTGIGANLVVANIKAFRLKRIQIWSPPPAIGGSVACALEWFTADSGVMTRQLSDASNNPSVPAYISTRPPTSSAAWYWRSVTSVGGGAPVDLFTMRAPPGSIVQADLTVILNDTLFTGWQIATVAASTVGQMYYGGMDGIGAGAGLYPPIELYTIV